MLTFKKPNVIIYSDKTCFSHITMVSYYNYPSYNEKAYQVDYPKYNDKMFTFHTVQTGYGRKPKFEKRIGIRYEEDYFRKHFNFYQGNLYRFENYLTDEEKDKFDRYVKFDALNKYIKGYSKLRLQYPYKAYKGTFMARPRFYSESELRNLYPGLENRDYREDIQSLLSLASVKEARQRGLFSRPTYTNDDVMRYLFYTGSLDGNLYLRENGKKLYINDPVIQSDLRVVQKVQKMLGMKSKISDIVDFGHPATTDVQLGLPPSPNANTGDILHDLDISRKLDNKLKDAAASKGRAEVIPSNRISERFFRKNPLIYKLINRMHGNTNVLV